MKLFIIHLLALATLVQTEIIMISNEGEIQSLLDASKIAKPGDIIEFKAGTYPPQRIKEGLNGTEDKPIIVRPKKGAEVIIDCSLSDKDETIGMEVRKSSNIQLTGPFKVRDCSSAGVRTGNASNIVIT